MDTQEFKRQLLNSGALISEDGTIQMPYHKKLLIYFKSFDYEESLVLDSYIGQGVSFGRNGGGDKEGRLIGDWAAHILIDEYDYENAIGRRVFSISEISGFHVHENKKIGWGRLPDKDGTP